MTSTMTYDNVGHLTSDSSSAGSGFSISSVPDSNGWNVEATTAEGVTRALDLVIYDPSGSYTRNESGPYTSSYTVLQGIFGVSYEHGTDSTGVVWTRSYTSDPRFSQTGYFPNSQSWWTPSFNTSLQTTRAATLSDPNNPFSVVNLTETSVLNSTKTTTVGYLASNSKYTVTSPVGRKTYVTIDANERVSAEQYATYTPVSYTYDTRGRLSTISQSAPRTTTLAYNTAGFLSSVTNALSQATSFTYDAVGRVLTQTLPDSRVVTFTYDAGGNLASLTPPGGAAHSFLSNGFDLIAKYTAPATSFFEASATAEKVLKKTEGFIRQSIRKLAAWISSFLPQAAAKLQTFVVNRDTDYAYNNDRQLTSITRPDGQVAEFTYSGTTGRLSGITVPSGAFTVSQNPSYDRIDQIVSPDGVTQDYTYDGPFVTSATTSGAAQGSTYFTYNNEMLLASTKVGTAAAVSYTYDNDGLITSVGNQTITRNATTGFATKATLSNVSENYTYSTAFGELSTIQGKYSTSTNIYLESITRDNLGRVSQKVETIAATPANTYVYTFDPAGRLTTVTKNGSALSSYTYDSNSNRISQTISGVTKTATYDEQDRLRTWGTKTYSYNDAGELTGVSDSSISPAAVTSYTYDVFGNMKSATLPSGLQVAYLLDGQSRRVARSVGGVLQKQFVWFDSTRLGAELNSSGAIVSQFIYGLKGNTPDYIIKGSTKYKVITDHLGSVVAVVNSSNGVVAQRLEYDEFGRVLVDTSPGFQPFGFAGGLYDTDTKLTLFGARSYDAEVGRWVSKDPILFAGGDANLYGYVLNDPVNWVDPEGLKFSTGVWRTVQGLGHIALLTGTVAVGAVVAEGFLAEGSVAGFRTAIAVSGAAGGYFAYRALDRFVDAYNEFRNQGDSDFSFSSTHTSTTQNASSKCP
ncbi:MAG: hypothetical protein IPJ84_14070 [Bdellovibrionales bacterium]|nr:hypothetical protein [Bdellovibrionales bacterium]